MASSDLSAFSSSWRCGLQVGAASSSGLGPPVSRQSYNLIWEERRNTPFVLPFLRRIG